MRRWYHSIADDEWINVKSKLDQSHHDYYFLIGWDWNHRHIWCPNQSTHSFPMMALICLPFKSKSLPPPNQPIDQEPPLGWTVCLINFSLWIRLGPASQPFEWLIILLITQSKSILAMDKSIQKLIKIVCMLALFNCNWMSQFSAKKNKKKSS